MSHFIDFDDFYVLKKENEMHHKNLEREIREIDKDMGHKLKTLVDAHNIAMDRIEALEQERDKGIERLKKLESLDQVKDHHLAFNVNKLCERVHELEDGYRGLFYDTSFIEKNSKLNAHDLNCRIKVLEDFVGQNYKKDIGNLNQAIEQINAWTTPIRRPHKCPVCEGTQKIMSCKVVSSYLGIVTSSSESKCNACEGKGIIWG